MLSETVVSALLAASITGAGLVLAIYALVTPISDKIFRERARKLDCLLEEFDKEKSKITADAPDKDFKRLKNLGDEIKQIRIFPRYLGGGTAITFLLFMLSAFVDSGWLLQMTNRILENDMFVGLTFYLAVLGFLFIGFYTIGEIFNTMKKEYEEIKKKQKEAKEYTVPDAPKSEDIKALKQ